MASSKVSDDVIDAIAFIEMHRQEEEKESGAGAACAQAQSYPVKPIRIIIPFVAGGPSDVMMRMLANRMQPRLSQGFVIETRAGAGGIRPYISV